MKTVTVVKLYKTPFDKSIKGSFCVRNVEFGFRRKAQVRKN